ncbi:nucleotide disphospho-sugar-binding domain-containing protein [Streptosporangium sandarakinum]|uniref:nucleotide disphospho-sugar-binding domain-containing protein n=1 Tax=Streptosporangium sandarakinum TaxID=1260955 RepID=UPI0033B2FD00
MRVMLSVWPQTCHLYPAIPYAQALQLAGHEVCVACPPGAADDIVAAGLTAVVCGEPETDGWLRDDIHPKADEMERLAALLEIPDAERDNWDVFFQYYMMAVRFHLPSRPSRQNEALVEFARSWKPDLVLWDPWFPAGAVAARASGAAHARVLMGPDYSGWAVERFAAHAGRTGAGQAANPLAEAVRPLAAHYGVEVDEELLVGQWTVDPMPVEMRLSTGITSLPVRWSPYNGGGVKPAWLYGRPERPRLALSVGLSTRAYHKGEWRTPKILEAVADLDVEVVATLNADQLEGVGAIPDNVRTVDYVPLVQLLPTCSASINHGSSGTFWASVAAGLPQIITDTDEPQRVVVADGENSKMAERHILSKVAARYVEARRAGLRLNHQTQTVEEVREQIVAVLEDPAYRAGADAVHAEWLAKPGPGEIVADLEKLTAEHRRR